MSFLECCLSRYPQSYRTAAAANRRGYVGKAGQTAANADGVTQSHPEKPPTTDTAVQTAAEIGSRCR